MVERKRERERDLENGQDVYESLVMSLCAH